MMNDNLRKHLAYCCKKPKRMARAQLLQLILLICGSVLLANADFGQEVADEAVDLFAAQAGDEEGDPRSMEDLLHWAIAHSDPEKLAAQADEAQRLQMVRDLKDQRRRVNELLDHVRSQTTETDMMKEGIAILQRADASETELIAALQALQVLVEPLDNANDLRPLGGIAPLVGALTRGSPALTAAAAYALGTAASNNPPFQRHLLIAHPEVLVTLLNVSQSRNPEAAVKGVYALAALVRNTAEARQAFVQADGFRVLGLLLRGSSVGARVKRKALSLFMDLVDTQPAAAASDAGGKDAVLGDPALGGVGGGGSGGVNAGDIHTIHLANKHAAGDQAPAEGAAASDAPEHSHGSSQGAGGGGGGDEDGALAAAAIAGGLPEAVVALLSEPDADMQEKALLVVQRLAGDVAARQALAANGAAQAVARLRQQLQLDAPGPGDDPDPYHHYLTTLARQVAVVMATEPPVSQHQSTSSPTSSFTDAGQRDPQGCRGPAGEHRCHQGDVAAGGGAAAGLGPAGSQQQAPPPQVLALGGPSGGRGRGVSAGRTEREGTCDGGSGGEQCAVTGSAREQE